MIDVVDITRAAKMFVARDMAIANRFLGFVGEVLQFLPISRTLRVLVMQPTHPSSPAGCELVAVFFAPGVKGVAVALWDTNRPSGAAMPRSLLQAFEGSAKTFREVTAPEEIHSALTALNSALEAQLRGQPKIALILGSAFAGAAFNLAATAAASANMPLTGDSSLANYLAMVCIERKKSRHAAHLKQPAEAVEATVPITLKRPPTATRRRMRDAAVRR
jgi:hypothetical protein